MVWVKKIFAVIVPLVLFVSVFFVFSREFVEQDMWFHLKSGEIIAEHGIIYQDLISQAGPERTWYPYEWSFQLGMYHLHRFFGLEGIFIATGIFASLQIILVYLFVTRVFGLKWYWAVGICLSYVLLTGGFFSPRPQIVSKVLFMGVLFLIHLYTAKGKNLLILTLPLIYVWSTFHASLFLAPLTFFLYLCVCFSVYLMTKEHQWLGKFKILLLFTILATIVSFLPPTGWLQYYYMYFYAMNREVYLSIHEGSPVHYFLPDLLFYLFLIACAVIPAGIIFVKDKASTVIDLPLLLPSVFYILFGFIALRSMEYGFLGLLIILTWVLSHVQLSRPLTPTTVGFCVIFLGVQGWGLVSQLQAAPRHLPEQAAEFLNKNRKQGNIFNLYEYGGYLSYKLYPNYKIFIDGRTDVYVCCELKDYTLLQSAQKSKEFSRIVQQFLKEYEFTTVVLTYRDNQFGNAILKELVNYPEWNLVFWDDADVIFIKEPTQTTATPFSPVPYKPGQELAALETYTQMDHLYPSALSKHNIGYIYLSIGKKKEALQYFKDAIKTDPTFHFAYYNLAMIAIQEGKTEEATSLIKKAIQYAPKELQIVYQERLKQL